MPACASSSRSPDLAAIARVLHLPGRYLGGPPHGYGYTNDTYAVAFAGPLARGPVATLRSHQP